MSLLSPPDLQTEISHLIDVALAEDIGPGDLTSLSVIPKDLRFTGVMAARQVMVVAGLGFAGEIFSRVSPSSSFHPDVLDGDEVAAGTRLAWIEGPAAELLSAERTALNLLQHLSGIATATRRYVTAIEGTGATLLDTRKTIPGLRQAAKYATRMGGARNHRMGLYDSVLIKDNHIAVCGCLAEAVRRAKSAKVGLVEVECDTLGQVGEALAAGADIILLDNMTTDQLRQAVAMIGGKVKTEASGGVTLDTIRAIAETGVDYISVGRLTQSAAAIDIGLDWTASR
jgi:nicotinate-nucleotide pyrophosphorylase (carboxylating)